MVVGQSTEYKQGDLTFTLFPTKTVVATPLQRFYLYPRATYYNRRHNLIRVMVQLGEIRDLNELSAWCHPGIEWRATSLKTEQLAYTKK